MDSFYGGNTNNSMDTIQNKGKYINISHFFLALSLKLITFVYTLRFFTQLLTVVYLYFSALTLEFSIYLFFLSELAEWILVLILDTARQN